MSQSNKNLHSSFCSQDFSIDRSAAIAQLTALGYLECEMVYLRAIPASGYSGGAINLEAKFPALAWAKLEDYQKKGKGIYVVVNGGGHADKDVTQCRAIFCEFDDRPIEDQINFWQELGLPEPSLQIATRKSVHTYWVFDKSITVARWRELQTALLAYTRSDPALKNPSRVMRLAGAYHIKPGCEPLRCDIIHQSDKRYSYEELQAIVPLPQRSHSNFSQLPQSQPASKPDSIKREYQRYEDIQIPVPQSIPLEVCLSKESRRLLESGVGDGGRNVNGAKLVRDLIGTANHLQAVAQQFLGEPRRLLEDYASRCTPLLDAKEIENIWKSALKDNPTPSSKPEGVEACIRGWYWKNHVKTQTANKSNNHISGRGFGNSNNNSGNKPPVSTVTLCERIKGILERSFTESVEASALMDLASAVGRSYSEINQLARIIRTEGEDATEVIEAVQSLKETLKNQRKRLDIECYLESALAQPLIARADSMPTAVEYLFNTLIPANASRIGTAARIVVDPASGYTQPCNFWTANVGHSGQAKTPPQQAILKPLEAMEADAKKVYDLNLEDYEQDKNASGKPPVRQRRLLNNVTSSTKFRIHEENPRGLLEYMDELVADYQRLNQYKNGKGDDLQLELTFWNGSGANFDRQDARLFLGRTAFSKTGTYQWDTLAKLMRDDVNFIASGYSARFLYCSIDSAPPRYLDLLSERRPDTLTSTLHWLYERLESLPEADYNLSHEAKVLFQGWNHTLVNAEIEEKHFGLSLVYAKIESYTARLALWLHIVNATMRCEKPLPLISGETMLHAIEIASFYLWQQKLIHAHNAPSRQPEGIFLKVQTQAEKSFKKCGLGVKASFLKTRINALKGWAVEKIRTVVFKALAAAGHGRMEGFGSDMVYIPNLTPDDETELVGVGGELVVSPMTGNPPHNGLQTKIGEIGAPDFQSTLFSARDSLDKSGQASQKIPATNEENSIQACPLLSRDVVTQQLEEHSSNHQFTNKEAEIVTSRGVEPVGDTTNLAPTAPISCTDKSDQVPLLGAEDNSPSTTQPNIPTEISTALLSQSQLQQWLDSFATVQNADDCMDCLDALNHLPLPVAEQIWNNASSLLPRFWEMAEIEATEEPHQDSGLHLFHNNVGHPDTTQTIHLGSRSPYEDVPHCYRKSSGVGFGTEVSAQQQTEQPCEGDRINITPSVSSEQKSGVGFAFQASPIQIHQPSESDERITMTPGAQKPDYKATTNVSSLITGLWVRCRDGFYGHLGALTGDGRWWVSSPKTRNSSAESRLYAAADIIPIPAS